MIKEKEINVNIISRNIRYYVDRGYSCNVGDTILVKIEDSPLNSHVRITAICDKCGYESNISIQKYNKNYKNCNIYTCKKCAQIKNKITNNIKFGVDHPLQNSEIYNNMIKTNVERYGVENVFQSDEIKIKSKITNNIKFGVDYPQQNKEILEKSNETNLIKYGFKRPAQNLFVKMNCKGKSKSTFVKENELIEFIRENYKGEVIENDRKILSGKELDVYLPDLNLAFEYNGLYWHSNLYKEDDYHINKNYNCSIKNIQLVHIWEDYWLYDNDKAKNNILNLITDAEDVIEINSSFISDDFSKKYDILNIEDSKKWNISNIKRIDFDPNSDKPYICDCGVMKIKKKNDIHV